MFNQSGQFSVKKIIYLLSMMVIASSCARNTGVGVRFDGVPMGVIDESDVHYPVGGWVYQVAPGDVLKVEVDWSATDNDRDVEPARVRFNDLVQITFKLEPGEYHLIPGDELIITVDGGEKEAIDAVVRADNKVVLADLGVEVSTVGLTVTELSQEVQRAYTKVFLSPQVSISVVDSAVGVIDGLSDSYPVSRDGNVVLPLLGLFEAVELTAEELGAVLSEQASKRF